MRGKEYPKEAAWEIESLIGLPGYLGSFQEDLNVVYFKLTDSMNDNNGSHFLVIDDFYRAWR